MSTANWIREPDLGSYLENYNFNLNPLVLDFESDSGATIKEINGSFPDGLRWRKDGYTVVIEGVSSGVSESTDSNVTLRITDPDGTISDRTFYMTITPFGVSPSWAGQQSFIGYATIGTQTTYQVAATYSKSSPITYRLIRPPAGMSIDPATGTITYLPPSSIIPIGSQTPFDITQEFSIRATADDTYETLPAYVIAMTSDHPPAWITVAGRIGEYISGRYVEYYLKAYDPTGEAITYTLVSPPVDFPFTLQPTGFLFGECPSIADDTVIAFTVAATTTKGTTRRTFNLLITQDTVSGLLYWADPSSDLGEIFDGQVITISVGAITSRSNAHVYHRFVGGSLPMNLTLNSSHGTISGYLDYHPTPRDYFFDIEATDGKQTISRRYGIRIKRRIGDQFLDVSLPVMADIKQSLADTKRLLVEDPTWLTAPNTLRNDIATSANLISGLSFSSENPYLPINLANLYLHSTTLNFGITQYADANDLGDVIFSRVIIDPLQGVNYTISKQGLPYTIHPPSLQNMRRALSEAVGYVNDGKGSDAKMIAVLDYEETSIKEIQVVDGGTGYYYSPEIKISGKGSGASATCTITVKGITLIERGLGWSVGDSIVFIVDRYNTVSMLVTEVSPQGAILSVSIVDGGEFTVFPSGTKTLENANGSNAVVKFDLGIKKVTMVTRGSGYDDIDTIVSTSGSEQLQSWETLPWTPWLEIAVVKPAYLLDVIDNNTEDVSGIMASKTWKLQHLLLTMQGKTWTGSTLLDADQCTFDGGQTSFVEWLEPIDTIFELDDTYFDDHGTRFDENKLFNSAAYRMWGDTIFDAETTIFDLYDTMFDMAGPQDQSITVVKKLFRLVSQQISGNNTVA